MSNLKSLASLISSNADVLAESLQTQGFPDPSFDQNALIDFPILDAKGSNARTALVSAATEIIRLALGPADTLRDFYSTCLEVGAVRTLINFNVPAQVPMNETLSYEELAAKVGLGTDILRRMVRFAIISASFFQEPEPGKVGHSATSAIFHRDPLKAEAFHWDFNVAFRSAGGMYESLLLDPLAQEPSQCGLSVAHKVPDRRYENMWDYYARVPEDGKRFHALMATLKDLSIWSGEHAVTGYDWSKLKGKTVIDCGGSTGHISMAIAEKFPEIRFIVQDRPENVDEARKNLPAKFEQRISFATRDFFDPQPTVADCYFFRWIFHDWSDRYAQRIIKNLIPGMRNGAKLVIMEGVIPPHKAIPLQLERNLRVLDSFMWTFYNGKERELQELIEMVTGVDGRFKYDGLKFPPGSALSVLEFTFVDGDNAQPEANGISEKAVAPNEALPDSNGVAEKPVVLENTVSENVVPENAGDAPKDTIEQPEQETQTPPVDVPSEKLADQQPDVAAKQDLEGKVKTLSLEEGNKPQLHDKLAEKIEIDSNETPAATPIQAETAAVGEGGKIEKSQTPMQV